MSAPNEEAVVIETMLPPAHLKPPETQDPWLGLSAASYRQEMERLGWPGIKDVQEEMAIQDALDGALATLDAVRGTPEGRQVEVLEIVGEHPRPRNTLFMNLWLSLLHTGHAAFVEERRVARTDGEHHLAKLVVHRKR
ncbi:MAG TPA: hypothetical protein VD862_00750 [Candidatus Paceibacterota bacterium]|nr:hypothetical protein [Candidatus Paceibacterota bacterium]